MPPYGQHAGSRENAVPNGEIRSHHGDGGSVRHDGHGRARACLKGCPGWVVGHKVVTWRVGARNAMRSPVDESSTKKTFIPETSCLPYRPAAGRT
jgi:hypothetical protein